MTKALAGAALVVALAAAVLLWNGTKGNGALEVREQIYSCMVVTYWEDGSSQAADAEAATECMRLTGVYDDFLRDFK